MHRFLIGTAIVLFTAAGMVQGADLVPGSQYVFTGESVTASGLGFSGVSRLGSIQDMTYNPAALGDLRRVANSLSVGGFGVTNTLFNLGFAYPTLSGVYSLIIDYISGPQSSAWMSQWLGFRAGISKPITSDLFWGFSLDYAQAGGNNTNDWSLGIDMGILKSRNNDSFGVGFKNLSYGIVLKNIGKLSVLGSRDPFPGMGVSLGASFYPLWFDAYKLRLSSDIHFSWSPLDFQAGIGIEQTLLNILHLRAGYVYSANGIGPFTLGAGFSGVVLIQGSKTDVNVDYSASQQNFYGTPEWLHQVNLNVAWGYYDDKAPEVEIQARQTAFSPNFDGSRDEVELALGVKDNTMVDAWEVEILSPQGKVIKTFNSIEKLQVRNLSLGKAVRQIFSSRKQVEIPPVILWNGQDAEGVRVPDGKYTYLLRAWDENRNKAQTTQGQVVVDTVMPEVLVVQTNRVFSPNNDGTKDTLLISLKGKNIETNDAFVAHIRNAEGVIIKTYRSTGSVPAALEWDGGTDGGTESPEGTYSLKMEIKDPAGNRQILDLGEIRLFRAYQEVKLQASGAVFSPNNDGEKDGVMFYPTVSDSRGLESWTLSIQDTSSNTKRVLSGEKELPGEIFWDGRDPRGTLLPDGHYLYSLRLEYESGNHPSTLLQSLYLDNTPPRVEIKPEYRDFSPNRDGKRDTLKFVHVLSGQEDDVITATIRDQNGSAVYYAKSNLKDFPAQFVWNGLDRDLNPLPEGLYTYTIETLDAVGNKDKTEITGISLKTGLEKVSVNADGLALSPGNPQAREQVVFSPQVTSKEGITAMKLEILDRQGIIVRTLTSDRYVDNLIWDGKDEKGYALPDGEYKYKVSVSYTYGDEPVSTPRSVFIDTSAPRIKVASSDVAFSPNNDGRKDTFSLKLDVDNSPDDLVTLVVIQDKSGKIIRKYEWKGSVPPEIHWDGRDEQGKMADEGLYRVEIIGEDLAKNKTRQEISSIRLKKTYEELEFSSQGRAVAPNGDGNLDTLEFTSAVSTEEGLEEARLEIRDAQGKTVRSYTMKKASLPVVVWDGKDDKGKPVPDGNYSAQMSYQYDNGNLIQGEINPVILDKTPPLPRLTVSPRLFTPDGDGENDTLFINLDLDDPNGVDEWSIRIFKLEDGWQNKDPLKTWSGKGSVRQLIEWDGIGDDKDDGVESVQDYIMLVQARDNLGNVFQDSRNIIPVGVLVEKTPDGLRIRVSAVTFDVNKANLTAQTRGVLDKVIQILARIMSDPAKYGLGKNFRIEVSGHTDDTGNDDYNEKLSTQRALSVYQYLLSKDINPDILTYKGYGEQRPVKVITPEMNKTQKEKYRGRNRRVEFFIRK